MYVCMYVVCIVLNKLNTLYGMVWYGMVFVGYNEQRRTLSGRLVSIKCGRFG